MEIPEMYRKKVLILGCGNVLFGDDGFGPAVIENLKNYELPEDVCVIDAGTGSREILFDLLLGEKPRKIIIIDAVNKGRKPGEIFELKIDELPSDKTDDFSLHISPASNLLKELQKEIDVMILAVQVSEIPDRVKPGLSKPVKDAVGKMCELILNISKP